MVWVQERAILKLSNDIYDNIMGHSLNNLLIREWQFVAGFFLFHQKLVRSWLLEGLKLLVSHAKKKVYATACSR
jgi:hypothetical protein